MSKIKKEGWSAFDDIWKLDISFLNSSQISVELYLCFVSAHEAERHARQVYVLKKMGGLLHLHDGINETHLRALGARIWS